MARNRLVIVGDSAFAEVARDYFDHDSDFEVIAHSVERAYLERTEFGGLPVVPFEDLDSHYSPDECYVFVALVYGQLNRVRTRLAEQAKKKGYPLASYISSNAFCGRNVQFGEHVFVFEDNTIQPCVSIGNNVVLWSGNHVGHHSVIEDNCFISSHVVISGFCRIGQYSFMGVNSTLADQVTVARDNWIGPGITLVKDTEPDQLYGAEQPTPAKVTTHRFFRIKE